MRQRPDNSAGPRRATLLLLIILLLIPAAPPADTPPLLKVKARRGDGIYRLLGRYQLPQTAVYVKQFKEINNLPLARDKQLVADRHYKMPIRVYRYNGKSIRSTIGITDRPLAERIQAWNRSLLKAGLQTRDYASGGELWVPLHDISPTAPSPHREFPIFGPKLSRVESVSSELAGCVFYLVSGHGGPDTGAIGKREGHDLCEDEYAYDITLRLARKLIEQGAEVHLIVRDPDDGIRDQAYLRCDKDEVYKGGVSIPRNQRQRLKRRAGIVNSLAKKNRGARAQRLVVIHVDSRSTGKRVDMFFYHHSLSSSGRKLARTLHKTIEGKYKQHQPRRGYSGFIRERDGLYMLQNTSPTTVYIELGNIRNGQDQIRLIKPNNRQAVANWLAEGLTSDIQGR